MRKLFSHSSILFLIASAFCGAAQAQQRAVPGDQAQVQLSFAPIVRETARSVVNVYGARPQRANRDDSVEEFFQRYFGNGGPRVPPGRAQTSVGSGVIVDASGLVVTNNHVIENMTEVKVALFDRREIEAKIVLRDPRTDLAVLKLENSSNLQAMDLGDSEQLEVGDLVLAIGNPFGVGQTVTQGIVSALARTQIGVTDYQFFIQTDAAINPGNSGGALVSMDGKLVGINTAIFSRSGGSHGIGFAIPSAMVRAVLESAKGGSQTVRRPWLGARLQSVDGEIATSLGLERPTGVVVISVADGGPAAEAGVKRGDVILAVDGQTVDDPEAFGYRFALKGTKGETALTLLRNAERKTASVKLILPPETRPRDALRVKTRSPLFGATLVNLSPAVADELQVDALTEGVVVFDLEDNTPAVRVGFQKGDQIVAINGQNLASTKDLDRVLRGGSGYWEITINRNGRTFTTVLGR